MAETALSRLWALREENMKKAGAAQTASVSSSDTSGKKNNGSALAYLGEKLAVGAVRSVEGIVDLLVGGVADIVGAEDYAKKLYSNDWFGDWYSHPDKWYNPGEGMAFAGDVAGGIGSSVPATLAAIGVGLATGGIGFLPALAAGLAGGTSAAGNTLSETYKETGELNSKTYGYAALSGFTEGTLEFATGKLGTGAVRVAKGVAKAAGKEVAEKVAKSGAKKVMLELGKEFVSEGFEEGMSTLLDPIYRRATIDPGAENASLKDILYDATVGGFSGMIMGGATTAVESGAKLRVGNKIVNDGRTEGVLNTAQAIVDYENKTNSGDDTFTAIRDTLDAFKKSLESTDGEVRTGKQKKMLAELEINSSFSIVKPVIKNSALRALHNADAVAERFNAYGIKDGNGNPITITAEQIRDGVDISDPKSITAALKTNNILRTLAVMDATGQLVMNQGAFAEATLSGENYATQDDLNTFAKEADPETFKKVSEALNITDEEWRRMTPELFTEKMEAYKGTDEGKANVERAKRVREAKNIPESEAKEKLPISPRTQKNGSIKRYKTENADIAIIKDDGKYTIFNYQSRKATRALSLSETVSELERLKGENENVAQAEKSELQKTFENEEKINPSDEKNSQNESEIEKNNEKISKTESKNEKTSETTLSREYREAESFAEKNIPDYNKLYAPVKRAIQRTIVEARANGLSDADIATFAKFSAKSGINVAFDKQKLISGCDEQGNIKYADGLFDGDNTIYINKDSKRRYSAVIFHELMHSLVKNTATKGDVRLGKKLLRTALKKMDPKRREKIIDEYTKHYESKGEEFTEGIKYDEILAHYTEDVMGDLDVLDFLEGEVPGLGKRIVGFFNESARTHSGDENLSREARKYARRFRELYRQIEERHKGMNATEGVKFGERMAYAGTKAKTANNTDTRFALPYDDAIDRLEDGTLDTTQNTHLRVLEHTPQIYIDKAGASDREIVMSWDSAYLAMNKNGTLSGNYHGLGAEIMKALPAALEDPLYIVKQKNGRIAAVTKIVVKGKRAVFASIELEAYQTTIQEGETEAKKYNLVVTVTDAKPNYLQNTIFSGEIVHNKNSEDPAHFILRLKSLEKAVPTYDLAGSSNNSITENAEKSNTFPKKSSEKISNERFALDIDTTTETDAEELPNTLDSVAKSRETYSPGFWKRLFNVADKLYIEAVDELFGVQKYLSKVGKRKDSAAIVNMARSSRAQAQSMIGSVQYDLFSGNYEELGEGIQQILAPITKVNKAKGETREARALRVKKFNDYMLHQMNIDRMTLEERSKAWHEEDVKELAELNEKLLNAEKAYAEAKAELDKLKGVETDEALLERKKLRAKMSKNKGYTKHLKTQIKPIKEKVDSFVPLKNKAVFGENATRAKAVTAEQSRRIAEKYEKENPEFKEIAEKVYGYLRNNQKMRVEAGLITQEAADYMQKLYPHYVPTYRDTSYSGAAAVTGAGNIAVSSTVKRAKGGGQNILELQNSIAEQTEQLIKAANINRIATAIYEAAVESGDTKFVSIISREAVKKNDAANAQIEATEIRPQHNQVTFFYKGEKITMSVSREIFIGFEGLYKPTVEYDSVIPKALTKLNKAYKAMVTSYSPAFLVRNPIRDIQDAGLNSKHSRLFIQNLPKAWKDIFDNAEDWKLYRAMGGFSSTVFTLDGMEGRVGERGFTELKSLFDSVEDQASLKKWWSKASAAGKAMLESIGTLNAVIEQVTRFAEFKASLAAGDSAQVALYNSAEVTTNFGRRGRLTKTLNATIMPFLNPAIQGFDKMFRNVKDAVKAGELKLIIKAFAKLLTKAFIIGMAPQILNAIMYSDDEDYEDLRENDKENNFLLKVGDSFIKIPRGRVASVIGGAVNRLMRVSQGKDADFKGYLDNVISQVTPAENISRTIFSPFNDVRTNTTWYGTDIEGREFDAVAPRDRYDESTSNIAVFIGQTINYSPKKIHYLLDQYSGVLGDIVLPATTPKSGNPLLSYKSNFLLDPKTSNKISSEFYKLYDEVQYAKSAYDTAKEAGTAKEGDEAVVYQLKYLNRVKKSVSELYDQKRAIQGSTELSAVDKLQQARTVQMLINAAQKNAIADFEEMVRSIEVTKTLDEEVRFTEATRIVYGAESALEAYDEKVYEKAQLLSASGLDYEDFYYYYFSTRDLKSDKDKKGNTIPGSKRKKVVSAILDMGLGKEQTLLLIASSGYSLKDGDIRGMSAESAKRLLAKYIASQKLTKEQKKELAEKCGFTVRNGKIIIKSE